MKLHRIWAIVLRHLYFQRHDLGRTFDLTFWPVVDIVMFGFMGMWLPQSQSPIFVMASMPLLGALLWQIVKITNLDISVNILEEMWQQNLCNLFTTPLLLIEWVVALLLLGFVRIMFMMVFCGCIIYLLFNFNLLMLGFALIPIVGLLMISGWALGLFCASLIMYWGRKVQSLSWVISWVFAPFCAVFYPLAILPSWMQSIAKILPMTYVFDGLREYISNGIYPSQQFLTGFILSLIYLVVAVGLFFIAFVTSKKQGLERLEKI